MDSSTSLYTTFGNEIKYKITQDTLVAYLDQATIKFALPEASTDLLSELLTESPINSAELDTVTSKLISIGFQDAKARTMASLLLKVAESQNVNPMEYFGVNEASLKLAVDTYKTINLFRPKGNKIGLMMPTNNKKSRYNSMIQP